MSLCCWWLYAPVTGLFCGKCDFRSHPTTWHPMHHALEMYCVAVSTHTYEQRTYRGLVTSHRRMRRSTHIDAARHTCILVCTQITCESKTLSHARALSHIHSQSSFRFLCWTHSHTHTHTHSRTRTSCLSAPRHFPFPWQWARATQL